MYLHYDNAQFTQHEIMLCSKTARLWSTRETQNVYSVSLTKNISQTSYTITLLWKEGSLKIMLNDLTCYHYYFFKDVIK